MNRIWVAGSWDGRGWPAAMEAVWQQACALAVRLAEARHEEWTAEVLLVVPSRLRCSQRSGWLFDVPGVCTRLLPASEVAYRQPAWLASAVADLIAQHQPRVVLFPTTQEDAAMAATVAARLQCGLCAHVLGFDLDARGQLVHLVPSYGGAARLLCKGPVQLATVSPNARPVAPRGGSDYGKDHFDGERPDAGVLWLPEVSLPFHAELLPAGEAAASLAVSAPVIVGAGWGVKDKEGYDLVAKLAAALGAPLVVTRPVVDEGWAAPELLVGQSGRHIQCKLYLAVGISGDPQHMVGVQAESIVAINPDLRAPIYGQAELGIPLDFREVVPVLVDLIGREG